MKRNLLQTLGLLVLTILGGLTASAADVTETLSPTCDVTLNTDKPDQAVPSNPAIEMYTVRDEAGTITREYLGLMSFSIPEKSGYKIKSATLKLVTERAKGTLDIYAFNGAVSNSDTYNSQSPNLVTARQGSAIKSVRLAGTNGKAVTDAGASSSLADWTNVIDLTAYARTGDFNLLLTNHANSTSTSIKVYSSDAEDVTNDNEGFTFAADDLKPVLTVVYEVDAAQANPVLSPVADTFVRMGNNQKHGSDPTMEIMTDLTDNKDFVGLMRFSIPALAAGNVERATLRLVTERCKGATSMSIYAYGHDFSEDAVYADENDQVAAARTTTPVNFDVKFGVRNKSLVLDDVSAGSEISKWTNEIDLTDLVNAASSGTINLMIASADGNGNQNMFFTKEATDVTNAKDSSLVYAAADLVPQLVITYTPKYKLSVSESGASTLIVPFNAELPEGVKAYTLTYQSGAETVTATEVTSLTANTPVLINAAPGEYTFTSTGNNSAEVTSASGSLTGVYAETAVPAGAYVLQDQNGEVAFYRVAEGSDIKAGAYRAYLSANASAAKLAISFDDATAIRSVEKTLDEQAPVYNLQGVRMVGDQLPKGIYVKNGRKFVVK